MWDFLATTTSTPDELKRLGLIGSPTSETLPASV
jgi:hypothetical protein